MRALALLAPLALAAVAAAPLPGADADMGLVCVLTHLGWLDRTTEANDETPADVPAASANGVGALTVFYGLEQPFDKLTFDVGVPGTDNPFSPGSGDVDFFYWLESEHGSAWVVLDPHVSSYPDMQSPGLTSLEFSPPPQWGPSVANADCPGEFHLLMSTTRNSFATLPILDQVSASTV